MTFASGLEPDERNCIECGKFFYADPDRMDDLCIGCDQRREAEEMRTQEADAQRGK